MARAVIQGIVSDVVGALIDAGIGDVGTYTAPGGSAIPCRVIVNRARTPAGTFGKVLSNSSTVLLQLSEIPAPVKGAVVAADGDSFVLVKELEQDAAAAVWDVE